MFKNLITEKGYQKRQSVQVNNLHALGSRHALILQDDCRLFYTKKQQRLRQASKDIRSPIYLHCTIWPPSTDAALSRHPRLQTSYPPSAHSISPSSAPLLPSLAPGHFSTPPASSPPDSLRVLQWNAGGLRARSTELLHFLSSHPVDLICIQESNLTHLSLSGFLDSLLCVLIVLTPGLAFSLLMPRTLAAALSFSSGRAYLFLNFLPPLLLRLIPTLIMWGSTSLLTTPSRCYFLMCTPPYSLLPNGWQNRFLLSLHSSLLQKSLHSGGLQLPSPPLGLKRYFRPPRGGSI